jgi:hypothetical protein
MLLRLPLLKKAMPDSASPTLLPSLTTVLQEVQYKVFTALGLDDLTIRSWFNGPAFLTWSRGQNEYGNNIVSAA